MVYSPGSLPCSPESCTDRSGGKRHAAGCLVGKLQTFSVRGEHHGMVSYYIPSAQGMHAYFIGGTGTHQAFAAKTTLSS